MAVLGGAAFWDTDTDTAGRTLSSAVEAGVNHIDVAPQYGRAEEVLGPHIPALRDRLFVACKTLRHNAEGVKAQLENSLRVLRCDHFDLYQLHAVTDLEELDARAGALEVLMAARDEGLCRWIGITGHELSAPAAHLEALRRYDLDTVMLPVNPQLWSDKVYRRDAEALLAHAIDHDIGVMAIKAVAARPWAGRRHTSATWYEPYVSASEISRGARFALSTPGVHALCTPGDLHLLPQVLVAAQSPQLMEAAEREEAMTVSAAETSIFPMPTA
ncbi:MAG: aldo/keto reductase [Acidimicrobiales bacterium]